MKIIILYILIAISPLSVYAQKQLDSIYSYQFKNEEWEATTRRTYAYGSNFRSEYWSSYDKALGKYKATNYNRELYLTICDKQIKEKEFYGTTNDASLKTSTILWERDTECNVVKRTHRLASGDTTELAVFSDFDNYGSPLKELNYLRGQNGQLTLFRDYGYEYIYNAGGNITSQITSIVSNDIIRPSRKVEYTYINGGETESVVFFNYEPASASWRKTQEFQYLFEPKVEITKLIIHNTGVPVNTQIDSFFLDNDGGYKNSITYLLINGNYVNSFRNEYFYKGTTSSNNYPVDHAMEVKFINANNNQRSIRINNPTKQSLHLKMFDLQGKLIHLRTFSAIDVIEEELPGISCPFILTLHGSSGIVFSRLVK